ncbi:flagellar protein FlgN [Sporolactobacillus kofuensis]|uniref:Flagellar protein FlgN n=1 Tax=Sporolactobacillus kofuensis TaxID=269672 RepID=A0ABW1WF77_9BACL|nr:flagellar protein FlgN [Sporolactobacillus kofuensis]MCO7176433.1 flagellar protein FlgN [Sporolactobacillus kofuensis]
MSLKQMKQTMTAMIDCHDALYTLAIEKRDAVKVGDAQTVGEISSKETPLVERLQKLETARTSIIQIDLGTDAGESITFSDWEKVMVPEQEREAWQKIYLELANSVYRLKQANKLNQELLRDSLLWVKLNMNLLKPQNQNLHNYRNPRDGQAPSSVYSGRIDSRT